MSHRLPKIVASVAALVALAACSNGSGGEAKPAPTDTDTRHGKATRTSADTKPITAADACRFMTAADFPYKGEEARPPELKEKPFPECSYHIKIDGDITRRLVASLSFFPKRPLSERGLKNPSTTEFAGKKAFVGQSDVAMSSGECVALFEGAGGHWMINVTDSSSEGVNGCQTAKSIGEKVAARVP
ncbi:hypothetical protein GCM10012275_24570 [Longimycelium tulufanense]|uniref:DUF3558 domain-containing protein n=1 Tax=Longimycelium tulufanense TaxID=907463 RepID=A0A8J3FU74_9PSEU|nr:hypothetical protein [Longimycelium tulufanense]GGM52664.1 hypothetical protein GCM10012275_24570 [Longimycelium tulufanense]